MSQEMSQEELVQYIQLQFEQLLNIAQASCDSEFRWKSLRSRMLRSMNDIVRYIRDPDNGWNI